jgi:hypothetical protein
LILARVFPRKTAASPDDPLAFFGPPPPVPPDVDEIHVSVAFTADIEKAEQLAEAWEHVAPVKIGGPAFGKPGGPFNPGVYLKKGYVINSRGCHNKCWFCSVWKREPELIELPITEGYIEQSDNILACSDGHIRAVFDMLSKQKDPVCIRGLEAAILKPWHVDALWYLRPKQIFCAYDTPDDLEPLIEAGRLLRYADFTRSHLYCYVLIGYPKDTIDAAYVRLLQAWSAGFIPFAMLWQNDDGVTREGWGKFQRSWARPAAIRAQLKGTTWMGADL